MAKTETALAKVVPTDQPFLQEFASDLGITPVALWGVTKQLCIKSSKDAREATTEELFVFLMVCKKHDLNPLLKEAYAFIGKKGDLCTGITIDGWLKIGNRHPQMDGLEIEEHFSEAGKIQACTATVWRKDRKKPTVITEYFKECHKNTDPWNERPVRSLRHKAAKEGLRYAFAISGLSDIEEAQEAVRNADAIAETPETHTLKMPKDLTDEVPWAAPTETKELVAGIGRPIAVESEEPVRELVPVGAQVAKPEPAAAMLQEDIAKQEVDEPAEPEPAEEEIKGSQIGSENGSAGSDFTMKLAPEDKRGFLGRANAYEEIACMEDGAISAVVGRHSTKKMKYWCTVCCKTKGIDAEKGESCEHIDAALAAEREAKANSEDGTGSGEGTDAKPTAGE